MCITISFDLHTPPEYCFTGDDVKVSRGNLATVSFFLVQGLTMAIFQAFKNPLSGLVKPMLLPLSINDHHALIGYTYMKSSNQTGKSPMTQTFSKPFLFSDPTQTKEATP